MVDKTDFMPPGLSAIVGLILVIGSISLNAVRDVIPPNLIPSASNVNGITNVCHGCPKALHFFLWPLTDVFILLKSLFGMSSDREQSKIMVYVFRMFCLCFLYDFI